MTRPAAPRSRRNRPAKPPLSRDAIVAAALEIARTEGVEALSMRPVAQALDTGPASPYVYVADGDEPGKGGRRHRGAGRRRLASLRAMRDRVTTVYGALALIWAVA